MSLVVLATGPLATVQDRGRPGWAAFGVSPSGAADRGALDLGNRLVGNVDHAAGIEVTLGGLQVRATTAHAVSLTGADAPATVDGRPVGTHATLRLDTGATLALGAPPWGLRTYLAVRGGVAVPPVLGSRSYDVLSGLGPAPLAVGDELPIGAPLVPLPDADWAPVPMPPAEDVLAGAPGPREDWFAAPHQLFTARWQVSDDTDRVGVRLDGPALERTHSGELASEGVVRGAVQVPPSGRPVVLLADHPVTGGYPVIAVLTGPATDRLAQLRPGRTVRFRRSGG
ncbi:MAG: biotin-dependent carboxyltransferase family protein [bacterium]